MTTINCLLYLVLIFRPKPYPKFRYGYYTELLRPGFRIVSINSNFCNDENFWILTANGDPGHQHRWLIETLQNAEEHFQKTLRLFAHSSLLSQELGALVGASTVTSMLVTDVGDQMCW